MNTYVCILAYHTINHDPNPYYILYIYYIRNICKIQSYCRSIPIKVDGRIEYSVIKSFIPEFDRPFFDD